jgi:hypothetical protein
MVPDAYRVQDTASGSLARQNVIVDVGFMKPSKPAPSGSRLVVGAIGEVGIAAVTLGMALVADALFSLGAPT